MRPAGLELSWSQTSVLKLTQRTSPLVFWKWWGSYWQFWENNIFWGSCPKIALESELYDPAFDHITWWWGPGTRGRCTCVQGRQGSTIFAWTGEPVSVCWEEPPYPISHKSNDHWTCHDFSGFTQALVRTACPSFFPGMLSQAVSNPHPPNTKCELWPTRSIKDCLWCKY